MPTRNVVLTDRHQKIIDRLVRSGRYQNASEVLREGLRLVEQREAEDAAKLVALREAARAGAEAEFRPFGSFACPRCLFRIGAERRPGARINLALFGESAAMASQVLIWQGSPLSAAHALRIDITPHGTQSRCGAGPA